MTISSVFLSYFVLYCKKKCSISYLATPSYTSHVRILRSNIDFYTAVSEKLTCTSLQDEYYLNTRRVIDFDRLVRTIVSGFSSKDSRKTSNSISAATSAFAGTGRDDEAAAAIESLKQIAIALTSVVSTEGAPCVALTKTVGDLMALLPRQGK